MSRLIDADKLERQIVGYGSGRQEWVIKATKVDNAPTVDAEPVRHGFWDVYRWRDYDKTPNTELTCSVCGTTFFLPYDLNVDEFHYCPNCGAKMDEEARA